MGSLCGSLWGPSAVRYGVPLRFAMGSLCGSLWVPLRPPTLAWGLLWALLWGPYGVSQGSLWGSLWGPSGLRYGVPVGFAMGSLWRSLWGPCGVRYGVPLRFAMGSVCGSLWGPCGVRYGSHCGRPPWPGLCYGLCYGVPMGFPRAPCGVRYGVRMRFAMGPIAAAHLGPEDADEAPPAVEAHGAVLQAQQHPLPAAAPQRSAPH